MNLNLPPGDNRLNHQNSNIENYIIIHRIGHLAVHLIAHQMVHDLKGIISSFSV